MRWVPVIMMDKILNLELTLKLVDIKISYDYQNSRPTRGNFPHRAVLRVFARVFLDTWNGASNEAWNNVRHGLGRHGLGATLCNGGT